MLIRFFAHTRTALFRWNFVIILFLSPFAGHFIVTHDRKFQTAWLKSPDYYFSVAYSAIIAIILMLCIYGISFQMNKRYRDRGEIVSWLLCQLLYGVVVVVGLELVLATCLFWYKGYWILETAFFRKILGPVVMFILIVNMAYMLFYAIRAPLVRYKVRYLPSIPKPVKKLEKVKKDELPGLIYRDAEGNWSLSLEGKRMPWLETIGAAQKRYGKKVCFRGQRHWLVFGKAIADFDLPTGKRQVIIHLKMEAPFVLETSRRTSPRFKKWMDKYFRKKK